MFCYDGLPFSIRIACLVLALALAWILTRDHADRFIALRKLVESVSRRTGLSMALLFGVSVLLNATLTYLHQPQPKVHDEFAYQLAADTYASGRLTNPTHPHWEHFETFHVLSHPSYMAKYPAGNGLLLAVGQRLTGNSITGSWLAMGLALACLFWMLCAWIPARWALLGCLLLTINVPMIMAWSQTWWGGSLQLAAGALLFGSMKRIIEPDRWSRPTWFYASLFATGAVVLAITRPFEGLLACLLAGGVLVCWFIRQQDRLWTTMTGIVAPCVVIGGMGVTFLLVNNQAVTGKATTLPYAEHSRQHEATSLWIWKDLPPVPEYKLPRMESFYINWSRARQQQAQSFEGYVTLVRKKLNLLWRFFPFLGGLCLIWIPWVKGKQSFWLGWCMAALLFVVVVELQLVHSHTFPHYVAPFACLFYVLLFHGLRSWRLVSRDQSWARIMVPAIVVYSGLCLAAYVGWNSLQDSATPRSELQARLTAIEGQHLVFVQYPDGYSVHDEWVYNGADIDSARIVWAHNLTREKNQRLVEYYPERSVWIWRVGSELVPYPVDQIAENQQLD